MTGEAAIKSTAGTLPPEASLAEPLYRPPAEEPRRRTLFAQAVVDTFAQVGARLGLIWICIVIVLAVFAPFIASSYPLAMKRTGGSWEFPLFANLHPIDVLLPVIFLAALVLIVTRRIGMGRSLVILAGVTAVATPLSFWLTDPPKSVVWETYRQMTAAGEIEKAFYTVIPYSANDRLRDQPREVRKPPSARHWLGTTIFGEDMLSRMIHACRVALTIGFIATTISVLIGIAIGGLMGYFAGWVDLLGMRLIEIVQAIPSLILLLIVSVSFRDWARDNGISMIYVMMVVIGLFSWTANARFIRAEFLKLRKLDFVQAGIAAGLPLRSILFKHMLPNGVAPVLVNASFGIAGAILLESTLSFLGLGLEAEDPSWGQLLNQARAGGTGFNWWIATFPGLAIFLTVFAYILIGEAMRDALDPRLRKQD